MGGGVSHVLGRSCSVRFRHICPHPPCRADRQLLPPHGRRPTAPASHPGPDTACSKGDATNELPAASSPGIQSPSASPGFRNSSTEGGHRLHPTNTTAVRSSTQRQGSGKVGPVRMSTDDAPEQPWRLLRSFHAMVRDRIDAHTGHASLQMLHSACSKLLGFPAPAHSEAAATAAPVHAPIALDQHGPHSGGPVPGLNAARIRTTLATADLLSANIQSDLPTSAAACIMAWQWAPDDMLFSSIRIYTDGSGILTETWPILPIDAGWAFAVLGGRLPWWHMEDRRSHRRRSSFPRPP